MRQLTAGRQRSPPRPSALSLLLDTLDRDPAEAGVFVAKLCLKLPLFDIECLQRVHIGELQKHHASWWRRSTHADRFVKAAGDVFTAAFFDVGLRLGQKILGVAVLIFDIDFDEYKRRGLGLSVQDIGGAHAQNEAADYRRCNLPVEFMASFLL